MDPERRRDRTPMKILEIKILLWSDPASGIGALCPRMESNTNLHIWGKERKKKKKRPPDYGVTFFPLLPPPPLAKFLLPGALDLCSSSKFVVWFFLPRAVWAIIPAPTSPQYVHTYTKGYSESASVKAICKGYFMGVLTLGIYRQQAKSGCFLTGDVPG